MKQLNRRLKSPTIVSCRLVTAIMAGLITLVLFRVRTTIPGTHVPFALQPLQALTCGTLLGPWGGMISQLVYVLLLPTTWLKKCVGLPLLWGPMSGYLWGSVLVAIATGFCMRKKQSHMMRMLSLLAITWCCYHIPGMFMIWYGSFPTFTPLYVLEQGLLPFIAGDFFRVAITIFVVAPWQKMICQEITTPFE